MKMHENLKISCVRNKKLKLKINTLLNENFFKKIKSWKRKILILRKIELFLHATGMIYKVGLKEEVLPNDQGRTSLIEKNG